MLSKLFDKATDLLDNKLALLKLNAIEKIALIMGFCMLMIFGMSFMIAVLLILGMGMSSFFSNQVGCSDTAGYFITAGVYVVLLLLALLMKKPLLRTFAGLFVDLLTGDIDEHDNTQHSSKR